MVLFAALTRSLDALGRTTRDDVVNFDVILMTIRPAPIGSYDSSSCTVVKRDVSGEEWFRLHKRWFGMPSP
jgi:hypothetical protein